MSDNDQAQVTGPRPPRCDHICLKEADHDGTPHFHGYELPSPRRSLADDPAAVERALRLSLQQDGTHPDELEDQWDGALEDMAEVLRAAEGEQ